MFNFPNWLCEEIYFIVFVLQTPFVLNFNKTRSAAVLLLAFLRRRILQREKNEQQDRTKKGGRDACGLEDLSAKKVGWEGMPLLGTACSARVPGSVLSLTDHCDSRCLSLGSKSHSIPSLIGWSGSRPSASFFFPTIAGASMEHILACCSINLNSASDCVTPRILCFAKPEYQPVIYLMLP